MFAPFLDCTELTDRAPRAAHKVLRAIPDGHVSLLQAGRITPFCRLAEFRDAYSYLLGTLALQALSQDEKHTPWYCQSQSILHNHRLAFSEEQVRDALLKPGCGLLTLLALDCWTRSLHPAIYNYATFGHLSSAFQRIAEFCFATDVHPLSSLSKHARGALSSVLETALHHAEVEQGIRPWNEGLLHAVIDAVRNSGHFIWTAP
ncbi:hypothetical protein KTD31_02110 [Burkholderia multivorans]|jgi:hypothetical protein|uniref:hypothetical protein n=1 Tax=Burkholderia multivorans TaxID=87883 RepID=UPI001C23D187|nr:hypothetical protein [Burkholderia multivorans]MBU9200199.1 hypothetical protein [Burkholderia multivorans]MDN8078676.1 hypothetical protein [Burkholderia multivorans]